MDTERDHQPDYDPPQVEDLPAGDGPAITAAGDSPPQEGPEWRPTAPADSTDPNS